MEEGGRIPLLVEKIKNRSNQTQTKPEIGPFAEA